MDSCLLSIIRLALPANLFVFIPMYKETLGQPISADPERVSMATNLDSANYILQDSQT